MTEPTTYNVLIAEDNAVNQMVAVDMLEILGCSVEVANNGQEAFEKLSGNAYDVVFMDCQMPVMDGFEATDAIRNSDDQRVAATPVVAMTAHAMQGDQERCIAAGMDDYITKPLDFDAFERMLVKWSPRTSPTVQAAD